MIVKANVSLNPGKKVEYYRLVGLEVGSGGEEGGKQQK